MRQQTEILQLRVTPEIIRSAIIEKLKRDVPKLRIEKQKQYIPLIDSK